MNQTDRFERELTDWFVDTAGARTPDYMTDILQQTAGMRQRPAWSFLERWIPMSVITLGRQSLKPLPWRTIVLLALLAVLLAAAVAYVGSRPRLPAPFGRAGNGLVAYAQAGDIFTVNPVTGERRAIVTGPETDEVPRWSLDGRRLAFFRQEGLNNDETSSHLLVVADGDGSDQVVAKTDPLVRADSDSIAWSPDGRSVAVVADSAEAPLGRAIYIVDATDGEVETLKADVYSAMEVFWRPSDERQLMFIGGPEGDRRLYLFSLEDGSAVEFPVSGAPDIELRPVGWLPDGQRFAFHHWNGEQKGYRTHAIDLTTGVETVIGPSYGRLSNDGTRIVGFDSNDRLCVAPIAAGECVAIGQPGLAQPQFGAGVQWSPDDAWIVVQRPDLPPVLVDPDRATTNQPPWSADGFDSWQRVAP